MGKRITILGIVFVAAVWFWLAAVPWIENPVKFADWRVWLQPLLGLIVLTALVGLAFLLISERRLKNLVFVLVGAPAILVFGFSPFFPGALAITLLFHLLAIRIIEQETRERNKINIMATMRRGLPLVVAPLLMVLSFAYFLTPAVQESASRNELPPMVRQTVERTIDIFLGSEIDKLPPSERESARRELAQETIRYFNDLAKPYFKYAPPLLAFGLYLVLQGLSFIFIWFSVWLSVLIFFILKKSGFVRIMEKDVKAEWISF